MSTRSVVPVLPLLAVGVTLVLWASAFVAIRYLGPDVPPGALALGRCAVGAVVLGIGVAIRRPPWPRGRDWLGVVVIGVLWFGVYNVALNEAERRVDAGTAAILIQVSPVIIAVLAAVVLKERTSRWLVPGLTIAFAGVVVIAVATSNGGGGHRDVLGVLLVLGSALVYSISVIIQKPLLARMPAIQVTWLACTVGALACLPFVGQLAGVVGTARPDQLAWIVYLAVFPTAIAFTTYAYALNHMTATNLGVTTYLVPVITVGLAWIFLREVPPLLAVGGGVVCLVGVWLARRRPRPTSAAEPPRRETQPG